ISSPNNIIISFHFEQVYGTEPYTQIFEKASVPHSVRYRTIPVMVKMIRKITLLINYNYNP
ncbi:MAG: hypothetical protein ACMV17_10340, partial [Macellibacteroides fermentans]|uniref:hypothetical protein n=1 Tax=Macellibacteroides fermentans TaxID=879969 RepID=UPI003B6E4B0B